MQLREHRVTLQGTSVSLRPMTEDDWDILLKWHTDPEVLYYSEGEDVSSHNLQQVQYIYRYVSQNAFCFITEYESKPIGECSFQRVNLERILHKNPGKDCRRIDLMIGEKQIWGHGLGSDVIDVLTRFGFEDEQADLIFGCDIADYNPRSLKAFQNNGYRIDSKNKCSPGDKAEYNYDLIISRDDYYRKISPQLKFRY